MTTSLIKKIAFVAITALSSTSVAQTRSGWQMHEGLEVKASNPSGTVPFNCTPARHDDICEYDVSTIPPEGHAL